MANVITAFFAPSVASVPPQNRGRTDSDAEKFVVLRHDKIISATIGWTPGRKIELLRAFLTNDNVAQAASTNTTAISVDRRLQADGTSQKAGLFTTAAAVVAAFATVEATKSATASDRVVLNTESVHVTSTIAGTQGSFSVTLVYRELEVNKDANDVAAYGP